MPEHTLAPWPIHYIATHQAQEPDPCYCDWCFGNALGSLLAEERHQSVRHLSRRLKMDPEHIAQLIFAPKSPQGFVFYPN